MYLYHESLQNTHRRGRLQFKFSSGKNAVPFELALWSPVHIYPAEQRTVYSPHLCRTCQAPISKSLPSRHHGTATKRA